MNTIEENTHRGIQLYSSDNNIVNCNNSINNKRSVYYEDCLNEYMGNYWDKSQNIPFLILGKQGIYWAAQFDWVPASVPYAIP